MAWRGERRAGSYPAGFTGRAPLQPTWNGLMRILLSAKGEPATRAPFRPYQTERVGRYGGESCLVELFPLPSPSTSEWLYGEHSTLPELRNRGGPSLPFACEPPAGRLERWEHSTSVM